MSVRWNIEAQFLWLGRLNYRFEVNNGFLTFELGEISIFFKFLSLNALLIDNLIFLLNKVPMLLVKM
jgi:hypothetical protein